MRIEGIDLVEDVWPLRFEELEVLGGGGHN
jgi:hypothetical protein